jgi:tetratricopeptide (TPR) repeat protein
VPAAVKTDAACRSRAWCLAVVMLLVGSYALKGEDEPVFIESSPAITNIPAAFSEEALATARSLESMKEHLEKLQQQLERDRQESDERAARRAEAAATQLQAMHQSLADQRSRDMESLQSANRWMLGGAGIFALLACLTAVAMAWFQWRTVNTLAGITSGSLRGLSASQPLGALSSGEHPQVTVSGPVAEANQRFLGSLDRLEKRILELEAYTRPALDDVLPENGNGSAQLTHGSRTGGNGLAAARARASSLIGKGNALLSLDKFEEALACFDEILAREPGHAEAL